jgi:hypothetical protein
MIYKIAMIPSIVKCCHHNENPSVFFRCCNTQKNQVVSYRKIRVPLESTNTHICKWSIETKPLRAPFSKYSEEFSLWDYELLCKLWSGTHQNSKYLSRSTIGFQNQRESPLENP